MQVLRPVIMIMVSCEVSLLEPRFPVLKWLNAGIIDFNAHNSAV